VATDVPAVPGGLPDPGKDGDGRFMMTRPPTPPEAAGRLPGVMAGSMQSLQIPAAGGFSGRSINVYTPAGYKAGTPIAFMVFHDGGNGLNTPVIMDNLAFQKKMPPTVGIYIPPVDRSREYDTVNDKFTQYITDTVLPAVEARNITLTKDPEASGACGHSSGGILSFTMAWFHPERYRRVLTLSGSFVRLQTPGGDMYNNLVRTTMPLKPIRIAQIAGNPDANPQWVQANETMSASLQAAGYHNRYLLITGGTHNPASQNTPNMPDLLTWLWRNYPATGPTM
jgi:enterochelin esterase family protein